MKHVKKIYDPVHRFIHFSSLEKQLIHSPPFQRLRYIRQLGVAFFVYPGATHCRFEHSLGVMELATRIYDKIFQDFSYVRSLKSQFLPLFDLLPAAGSLEYHYWRSILRLSALCHDLGHLPFSHAAEKSLLGSKGHESWTVKIIQHETLSTIWEKMEGEYRSKGFHRCVHEDIIKISLGEKKFLELFPNEEQFTPWENIVTNVISGDFFGADRIDYLLRDAQSTGLAYGLFDYHQLIEMLRILPPVDAIDHLVIGVEVNGMESCEALLLARYYMHKRLYNYPNVKSNAFHLSRVMKAVYGKRLTHFDEYIRLTDNEAMVEIHHAAQNANHPGHFDAQCLCRSGDGDRFRAIPLHPSAGEEELKHIQRELNLPDHEISWEIPKPVPRRLSLSFPVLYHDLSVMRGEDLSEMCIPGYQNHWIYVSPPHFSQVISCLRSKGFVKIG